MKEMDCVEVIVERERYIKDGVHRGMQGWICDSRNIDDSWLVNFPQCGEKRDIATIAVKEKDLKQIPVMHASVNEQIKSKFENAQNRVKAATVPPDDISAYSQAEM